MSTGGHDTRTMIIVNACTMINVHVSFPAGLIFGSIHIGGCGGAEAGQFSGAAGFPMMLQSKGLTDLQMASDALPPSSSTRLAALPRPLSSSPSPPVQFCYINYCLSFRLRKRRSTKAIIYPEPPWLVSSTNLLIVLVLS